MYVTTLAVYGSRSYPLALGAIYEEVALAYNLPDLAMLQKSVNHDVAWPETERLQVHYLDSLTEVSDKDLFQVRFPSGRETRDLVSVFLSMRDSQVLNITFMFPGRTGRYCFSRVLGAMKDIRLKFHMQPDELQFEAQGFREEGSSRFIREHSLNSFVWVEAIGRYLHVTEDPRGMQRRRDR